MFRLPLDGLHRELGAKFFEFAGWEMPMKYTNSLKETLSVRNSVGIFDTSHMGRFLLRGPHAVDFLQRATSNNIRISNGRTRYTLTLNPEGGIKDDNVAFKLSDELVLFRCERVEQGEDTEVVRGIDIGVGYGRGIER